MHRRLTDDPAWLRYEIELRFLWIRDYVERLREGARAFVPVMKALTASFAAALPAMRQVSAALQRVEHAAT